ncbi:MULTISPECIES: glycosyltransferase family 4 protein [Enterococcus]|uniref:glycosyltransferase family 4 protein n=1 Tax=Enterococcus TaxID=1350 RepID=UPI001A8CD859|nr:glycosyltransferase family 4 protein [Enterococcus sp. DIV1094]MBO1299544.1 glycosyltransferase family 4 protein [Enterococcus sp. DIV1271a]
MTTISNTLNAFLIPHIDMLIKEGHEVSVACSIEQSLKPFFQDHDVEVYKVPFNRSPFSKHNLSAYKQLKKVINENNFDIVHTHTPVASMITRLACKKMKSRVFYTAHGFHFYKGASIINWLVYYPIEKYLSRYTDTLITINQEDYQRALKDFFAKNVYLVNGVGLPLEEYDRPIDRMKKREELGIAQETKVILSVGELNDNKNHKIVIEALKAFKNENFKYLICGIGPLEDDLIRQINEAGLSNKIELLGYRNDIIEIMKISDLFVFPSKREGLPVSVMEAMANGVPVMASDIRGNIDLITHGENGILFTSTIDLIDLFKDVFSDNLPMNKYIQRANETVKGYSEGIVSKQINEIYRN